MAKNTPKLSICIPYYKTYDLTVKLLERLIPQLTKETEVILCDDGCNQTDVNLEKMTAHCDCEFNDFTKKDDN